MTGFAIKRRFRPLARLQSLNFFYVQTRASADDGEVDTHLFGTAVFAHDTAFEAPADPQIKIRMKSFQDLEVSKKLDFQEAEKRAIPPQLSGVQRFRRSGAGR